MYKKKDSHEGNVDDGHIKRKEDKGKMSEKRIKMKLYPQHNVDFFNVKKERIVQENNGKEKKVTIFLNQFYE